MRIRSLLVMGLSFMALGQVNAAECTYYWDMLLSTDPLQPKGFSGDTHAAYGLAGFEDDGRTRFEVRGEYPHARFVSLSTVEGKKHHPVDAIEDYRVEPDAGSYNPFRVGVPLEVKDRSFTIEILPKGATPTKPNVLRMGTDKSIQAFMYRIFSPNEGWKVVDADFPRIFSYDLRTGRPKECPKKLDLPVYFRFPQFLGIIIPRKEHFPFKLANINWGPNSAIPKYAYAVNPMDQGKEVIVIRFKAPTYVNTVPGIGAFPSDGNVRYWSMCVQNFARNETLNCVPDHLAKVDEKRWVTVVYGLGDEVRLAAEARGYNFLEDTRGPRQFWVGFNYRNILPEANFAKQTMLKGEYLPKAVMCSTREFLKRDCR